MTYCPDINVWLALAFEVHQHHEKAKEWFYSLDKEECVFCRLTQLGFLRLSTNQKAFNEFTLTMDQAWQCYDSLLADSFVSFRTEPEGIDNVLKKYTLGKKYSTKIWNDAYLAAFAIQSFATLVTFDQGFNNYDGLDKIIL